MPRRKHPPTPEQWVKEAYRRIFTRPIKPYHQPMIDLFFSVRSAHGDFHAGRTLSLLGGFLSSYKRLAPQILEVAAMPTPHPNDAHMALYELQNSFQLYELNATEFLGLVKKAREKQIPAAPILRAVRHAFSKLEPEPVFKAANSALDSGEDVIGRIEELKQSQKQPALKGLWRLLFK